jgi:hypothetical protein
MGECKHRRALLLIDFDEKENRLDYVKMLILEGLPDDLRDVMNRVFILGVSS